MMVFLVDIGSTTKEIFKEVEYKAFLSFRLTLFNHLSSHTAVLASSPLGTYLIVQKWC